MTKREELKLHVEKLKTKREAARLAVQDFEAHGEAFNAWLKADLGTTQDQMLVPEIILMWTEKNDPTPGH